MEVTNTTGICAQAIISGKALSRKWWIILSTRKVKGSAKDGFRLQTEGRKGFWPACPLGRVLNLPSKRPWGHMADEGLSTCENTTSRAKDWSDFAAHLLREVVTWQPMVRLLPQTGGANTSLPCAQRKHVEGRPSSPPGLQTPNFVPFLFFRLLCFISQPVC